MHDYKKNIDFELLRKVFLLKCIANGDLYKFVENYEVSILNLNSDDIKFDEHFDKSSCIFCRNSNDKKIFIENVLCQSYHKKLEFKEFNEQLEDCVVMFDVLQEKFNKLVECHSIFKGKNKWGIMTKKNLFLDHEETKHFSDKQWVRRLILDKVFEQDFRDFNIPIYDFEDFNNLLQGGIQVDGKKNHFISYDSIYFCILHKINPYKYILDNDLHYKLYKGFEDILNEYEHDNN